MSQRVTASMLVAFTLAASALAMAAAACSSDETSDTSPAGSSGESNGSNGSNGTGGTNGSSGTSGASGTPGPGTTYAGCRIFPNDHPWNTDVSALPVDTDLMATVMPHMSLDTGLHPDWGTVDDQYGLPITVGKAAAPAPITWSTTWGPNESDEAACPSGGGKFCYPIPLDAKIEGGPDAKSSADRHVLFLATDGAPDHCKLYELYNTQNQSGAGFTAASGAIFSLDSNALRPEGWTSADASGMSVMAGLVRWEEVQRGEITHAIRFTMDASRSAYIHPATHAAGDNDDSLPPMGLRVRLKASFDDSTMTGASKVITTAMKKYGLILADNGSDWYISGESENAWGPEMDDLLDSLDRIKGSDFEIVKTGPVITQPD